MRIGKTEIINKMILSLNIYKLNDRSESESAYLENNIVHYDGDNLKSCFCALCLIRALFIKDIYVNDKFNDFIEDYSTLIEKFDFVIDEYFFEADDILKIDCLAYASFIFKAKLNYEIPVLFKNEDQVIIHLSLYL